MSVPDPYAEERAFLATLPGWRRFLARLNWHSPLTTNFLAKAHPTLRNSPQEMQLKQLFCYYWVLAYSST